MTFDRARLIALFLVALHGVTGCYLSRLRESPSDGGIVDASSLDARPRDAEPPPLDAGPMCPLVRADFTCLPSFLVQPGRPFMLPLSFDTLHCCRGTSCAVTVDAATRTLHLTSTLCAETCGCAAINTPVAECAIPALAAGDWIVEVNGGAAYHLPVMEDSGFAPPPPACVDFAEVDECTGAMTIDGRPQRASSTCAQRAAYTDAYAINVTDDCGTCDHESTCAAVLQPRLTSDLPPGGDLYVSPTRFYGACDGACDEICMEHTRRCEVPPLARGEYYRVFVGGTFQLAFTAGVDMSVCSATSGG